METTTRQPSESCRAVCADHSTVSKSTFWSQKTCEVRGNSKLDDRIILSHGRFVQVMGDTGGKYQEGRRSPEMAKAPECLCHISGFEL